MPPRRDRAGEALTPARPHLYGTAMLTIQIPVFNETDALRFSVRYFASIGRTPSYVFDSQATPEAIATGASLGLPLLRFENDRPFIENGYEAFAAAAPTDWIFRIDCDELPSPEAIRFAEDHAERGAGIVGFSRHQVIVRDGVAMEPTHKRFDAGTKRQYRLFDRRRVAFDRTIHTPGIMLDAVVAAPPECALFHFSWMFLSWEDRLEKAGRYDRFGQQAGNRHNQLIDLGELEWRPIATVATDACVRWFAESGGRGPADGAR